MVKGYVISSVCQLLCTLNIRLGRKDATDAEVLEAARLANVDEFAEKLSDKWNTLIGENGMPLLLSHS